MENNIINNRLTENQRDFFNKLKIYLDDTNIYFYGSITRIDYIPNKSDIDIAIFTSNENSTIQKLCNFLNINRRSFKKILFMVNNNMITGYKSKYKDEENNIDIELSIYNEKYKYEIIKRVASGTNLPIYKVIFLYIVKICYYILHIINDNQYSNIKNIINNGNNNRNYILLST